MTYYQASYANWGRERYRAKRDANFVKGFTAHGTPRKRVGYQSLTGMTEEQKRQRRLEQAKTWFKNHSQAKCGKAYYAKYGRKWYENKRAENLSKGLTVTGQPRKKLDLSNITEEQRHERILEHKREWYRLNANPELRKSYYEKVGRNVYLARRDAYLKLCLTSNGKIRKRVGSIRIAKELMAA